MSNNYLMGMHASQFASTVLPGIGLLLPFLLWLAKRNEPEINHHGLIIFNWMVSLLLFIVIAVLLIPLGIGLLLLPALAIINIIWIVRACVQVNKGQVPTYPGSLFTVGRGIK
ncbi:MAG: DUF4870 domain-containing protein [Idiomarina sp.]|nr:DUF4870 domain-containing protein [Idiomarina sp.]